MIAMMSPPNNLAGYDPTRVIGGYYYDEEAAERAVRFIQTYCKHVKGKLTGRPLILADWQADIIRTLFGWMQADGTRRYRIAYIEVPRKNGKSTLIAAIALYLLLCDHEQGAEIYSAARDADQATIVFSVAASMVRKNPTLSKRLKVLDSTKRMVHAAAGSFYRAIPADAAGSHGYNAHGILFDELHAQPNRLLWDVLNTSTGSRTQPLVIAITTAGYDRTSICWEQHQYAIKVREGAIDDPSFLPVIYAADEQDDYTDPAVWEKANPNLGVSLSRDYLARECRRAQETASYENTFRQLHLNQWTQQRTRFIALAAWNACAGDVPEFPAEATYAGLDLASTRDLTAYVRVWRHEGIYYVRPTFFFPKDSARKFQSKTGIPILRYIQDGLIIGTEQATTDYDAVRATINELGPVRELAYDPWNATQLANDLQKDGYEMVEVRQGMRTLNEPTKLLDAIIADGKLRHGAHPVMDWNASNVEVIRDTSDNIRPVKNKDDQSKKIDGIVALVIALSRVMVHREQHHAYEEHGLRYV